MRLLTSFLALALLSVMPVRANQPDSVYLFSYNPDPAQGLAFAYSADGQQ